MYALAVRARSLLGSSRNLPIVPLLILALLVISAVFADVLAPHEPLQVGALILVEASLSFLGVGVPPPTPAWGLMIDGGREYVATKYWLSLYPGLAIVLTVLSINWIGDWLRNVLDPKQQML